jgi:hypothetical protein
MKLLLTQAFGSVAAAAALALLPVSGPAESAETVTVTGTLTGEGVECPTMQGDDGTLYSLTPRDAVGLVGAGMRVRVEGTVAEMSFCQQGTTIEVTSIEPAEE